MDQWNRRIQRIKTFGGTYKKLYKSQHSLWRKLIAALVIFLIIQQTNYDENNKVFWLACVGRNHWKRIETYWSSRKLCAKDERGFRRLKSKTLREEESKEGSKGWKSEENHVWNVLSGDDRAGSSA